MVGDALGSVEQAIGYTFTDRSLLVNALTHSSFAAEQPAAESYERLEFLGDAVLELVTTEMIFVAMPDGAEGSMTKIRASLVDESTLADIARRWQLPDVIRLGVGEERSGGRDRSSILGDAVEAVIAAIYLDGGFESAEAVVGSAWAPLLDDRMAAADVRDPRSALQEFLAKQGRKVTFEFEQSGPDHAIEFVATAVVDGTTVGEGTGSSKKAAAIEAARDALDSGALRS
ncbi:MAG: ribonuclease III [Acidimicrobiia bacterium]|nr:ribonuclease III [Acidimicrobiia bacterium]